MVILGDKVTLFMRVRKWKVRKILNSKGEEAIEVEINGVRGSAPSGTSRSKYEVSPYPKGGIEESIKELKRILSSLRGDIDPLEVEEELIEKRDKLGGNGLLSLSIALYKADAKDIGEPLWKYLSSRFGTKPSLPIPLENVIGGGKHGGYTDIQEFLIYDRDFFYLASIYREIEGSCLTLESAKSLPMRTEEILGLLNRYKVGKGIDVAAGEMFRDGVYYWEREGVVRDTDSQLDYMEAIIKDYGLSYVEDPFHEDDFDTFLKLQRRVDAIIVGDDLFSTHEKRLRRGIGGIIIKYNQRGSILETVETVKKAKSLGMKIIVSHRSGETEDEFLSHFAVAMGADFAKIGAAGIRIVRINELLRIYETFQ